MHYNVDEGALVDTKLQQALQDAVSNLARAHARALNDWLERCVKLWCPAAHELAKAGWYKEAHDHLLAEEFRWTTERLGCDDLFTFWQGETPLMRCQIDVRFKH